MSKISTIYDSIITLVSGLLPDYNRLPNPYFVDENNQLFLEKGFGVGIGSASRRDADLCHLGWDRIFKIVLVQQITTTDSNVADREVIEKSILEAQFQIMNAIEGGSALNQNDIKADILGDSGITFLTSDRFKYLSIEIDVSIFYQENYV